MEAKDPPVTGPLANGTNAATRLTDFRGMAKVAEGPLSAGSREVTSDEDED